MQLWAENLLGMPFLSAVLLAASAADRDQQTSRAWRRKRICAGTGVSEFYRSDSVSEGRRKGEVVTSSKTANAFLDSGASSEW